MHQAPHPIDRSAKPAPRAAARPRVPRRDAPAAVALALSLLAGPAGAEVLTAWSMLVPGTDGTEIHARVVLEEARAQCPDLTPVAGGDPVHTTARTPPRIGEWPITVCEGVIAAAVSYTVAGGGPTLAAVSTSPTTVHVYGDSGCKSQPDCDQASVWPWPAIAQGGVAAPPDLILHMGDYNYRGTPGSVKIDGTKRQVYDAGDHYENDPLCALDKTYYSENAEGSGEEDGWPDWKLDFFEPTAELLPRAPWVFARGNHELCSRAGLGWFYLLDSGSDLPGAASGQRVCPNQSDENPPDGTNLAQLLLTPPYSVGFGTLQIAVLDSANACDYHHPELTAAKYQEQFAALFAELGETPTFFMTHRPLWAVKNGPLPINRTLQEALGKANSGRLPSAVKLSLAGHMHLFESLNFPSGGRQPQVVVGNSGVSLSSLVSYNPSAAASSSSSATQGCIATTPVAERSACGNSATIFGSLVLTSSDGVWSGQAIDETGAVFADCPLTPAATCTFVTDPCSCAAGAKPPVATVGES